LFDDFIGAAGWLISQDYTRPDKIGINAPPPHAKRPPHGRLRQRRPGGSKQRQKEEKAKTKKQKHT
jgi:hypothetical protein